MKQMWIARVVDNRDEIPTEYVGPMSQGGADRFADKYDNDPRFDVYLEMLCPVRTFWMPVTEAAS